MRARQQWRRRHDQAQEILSLESRCGSGMERALTVLAVQGWVQRGEPVAPWYARGKAPRTWVVAPERAEVFRPATDLSSEEILALPPGAFWWENNALWGWCWNPFQLRVVAAVYPSRRDDLWDAVRCAVHARVGTALAKWSFGFRGEHRGETTLRGYLEAHLDLWGALLAEERP